MALAGDFKEITFSDVLQLYALNRRTATLVVTSARTGEPFGYFYFEGGELFDARLGDAEGLEAVYRALELKEGTFHVVPDAPSARRRIFEPLGAMLLEGMRRLDEARRPGDEGIQQGDIMSVESRGRVCPTCRKRFNFGDVCPDDGSRLEVTLGGPLGVDVTAPSPPLTMPPPAALSRRTPSRGWWIALAASVALFVVLGGMFLMRKTRSGGPTAPADDELARAAVQRPETPPPPPVAVAEIQTPPVEPAKEPAPAPQLLAVRGVSDKEILFGQAAALTGPTRELGRQMKIGIEMAFNLANEAGGVNGRQLRLVSLDDGYEPARTATAMQELWDKHQVFGIVGNVGTPPATVSVPFSLEHKMLFYGAFTGAGLLRRDPPDRYVFNFRASYAEETAAAVRYLVKVRRLRPEQIAVFAQQDAYGDSGYAGVTKAIRALRNVDAPVLRLNYKRNTVDVNDAVLRLREHPIGIKAIVMVPAYRAAAAFINRVRDLYPQMIFTSVSFVGSTALADELNLLGPRYAAGVIVTQVVPPVESYSTAILKYKAALKKYFPGENPDYVSLEGYLSANVLIEALRRAGTQLDTEKLVDTLEGIKNLDLGIGTPISFGMTEHQGSHKVWGTQLDDTGHYQPLDLE
jgi:ABC-type branched-subunit amino acid transport system substrate-binding protein